MIGFGGRNGRTKLNRVGFSGGVIVKIHSSFYSKLMFAAMNIPELKYRKSNGGTRDIVEITAFKSDINILNQTCKHNGGTDAFVFWPNKFLDRWSSWCLVLCIDSGNR